MKVEIIDITIDSITLLAIVANLQLALSHPDNKNESAKIAKQFINQVTPRLEKIDAKYKVLIDAGFNRDQKN